MYSGHLAEKKGYFYCVITYKTSEGKRKDKWIEAGDFWWEFFEKLWINMISLRPAIVKLYTNITH